MIGGVVGNADLGAIRIVRGGEARGLDRDIEGGVAPGIRPELSFVEPDFPLGIVRENVTNGLGHGDPRIFGMPRAGDSPNLSGEV
jgi:hypothetical protein